jgi:Bacterial Ig-like domain
MRSGRYCATRQATRIACVLLAISVGLLCFPSDGAAASCPVGREIDYLAPLRTLPAIRRVPADRRLPFGPRHLLLTPPGELIAGGGEAGFEIGSDEPHRSNRLDWTVTVTLVKVSSSGKPEVILAERRMRLRGRRSYWLKPISLGVVVPGRPGFYRSDLTIARPHHPPATFSQYSRVVPFRFDVSLHLRYDTFSPGDTLAWRLENHGTAAVTYGIDRYLEGWQGIRWVPIEEEEQWFPPIGLSLAPGAIGKCEEFRLPADLQPGRYRVEKTVSSGKRRFARAYFNLR